MTIVAEGCIPKETDGERLARCKGQLSDPKLTVRGLVMAVSEMLSFGGDKVLGLVDPGLRERFESARAKVLSGGKLPYGERIWPDPQSTNSI